MNLLDWLLVALVVAYALSGYWQGFITGAFATAGLLLGGLFGRLARAGRAGRGLPSTWVSLGALFIVILAASLGQALFQFVGARIRNRITWQPIRAIDAVGGAMLSAAAVLLVGVGARGRRLGQPDRPGHPDGPRVDGPRQGQQRAAAVGARRAPAPSTTSSAPASSRATSSRSPPSGSSRSRRATSGCWRSAACASPRRAC